MVEMLGWGRFIRLERLGVVGATALIAIIVVVMTNVVEQNVAPRFFQFLFWIFRGIDPRVVFPGQVGFYFPFYRIDPTLVEALSTEIASVMYLYIPIGFFLSFPVVWISRRFSAQKHSLATFGVVIPISTLMYIWISGINGQYMFSPYGLYAHLVLKPLGFILAPAISFVISDKSRNTLRTLLFVLFSIALLAVAALFTVYLFIDRNDQTLAEGTLLLGPLFAFFLAIFGSLRRRYSPKEFGFMGTITGLMIISALFIAGKIWLFSTDQGNPWVFLNLHSLLRLWMYTEAAMIVLLAAAFSRILVDVATRRAMKPPQA